MSSIGGDLQAPTKVCRKCSVQTVTEGAFCPNCGAAFAGTKRSPVIKWVLVGIVAALILAGAGAAVVAKQRHDNAANLAKVAAKHRAEAHAAAQAAAARKAAEKTAAENQERSDRHDLITQMQASITKDAKKDVQDGTLQGPIFYTTCDPLGGGSADDLTALTTTFQCLAVNKKHSDGSVEGWVFSATANWTAQTYSWHLGH